MTEKQPFSEFSLVVGVALLSVGAVLFVAGTPAAAWWLFTALGLTLLVGVVGKRLFSPSLSNEASIEGPGRGLAFMLLSVSIRYEMYLLGLPVLDLLDGAPEVDSVVVVAAGLWVATAGACSSSASPSSPASTDLPNADGPGDERTIRPPGRVRHHPRETAWLLPGRACPHPVGQLRRDARQP
ncbi:hypothetical protein [Halomarina oriensis]|uniref:Uncharacterized protein n=1 Tax=Halomarina oriensis TaxID=671145 RepID=A0A6B0GLG2_9EURY|nr:hypothetical protein [Halomarina oriensis]MWG35756.1 hypothetical protein [Halomarina oriensis]